MNQSKDTAFVNNNGTEKSNLTVFVERRTKMQLSELAHISGFSMTKLAQIALDELIEKYTSFETQEATNEKR